MIAISGKWFDGLTSDQVNAVLTVYDDSRWMLVRSDTKEIILEGTSFNWKASARLANTPRHLSFLSSGSFETADNDGVDAILKMLQRNHWSLWVHVVESRMRYVLVAVVLFAVLAFAGVRYGIPAGANLIAVQLPEEILNKAGEQALAVFDRMFLAPSELDPDRAQQLRHHLQPVIDKHSDLRIEIMFRKGGIMGPNAFALPSGQIVFTDEIVALAENDNELLAVLAHEIGHVVYRHGVRRLIQDSLLSFAILAVTGDTSGVSELFLGLPVIFTELGYSRKFEVEADMYALDYLRTHSIAPHHFADIMMRITAAEGDYDKDEKWINYLSTHPATQDRIKLFSEDAR